jgi:hypothetical protein
MSGPQGSDPHQWQPPAQGTEDQTVAGGASPWQQQPSPTQDATWHAPAYTPTDAPQYQQPAGETAYAQQYPAAPPTYGPGDAAAAQATHLGAAPQFGEPTQYGQYTQVPGQYGPPTQYGVPGQYPQPGQPGQYPQQYPPYGQPKKSSKRLIWTLVAVFVGLPVLAILITGFGWPGFFITTELDVNQAQSGVQRVLTDETNGYGAKNVKDVKCNNGSNPKVEKGKSFDCTVSIDGTQKKVTATFQDSKGTYEVGRPQ